MTSLTPYAQPVLSREARAEELRLSRRAARAEAFVRAAILAAALATLALALNNALHSGSQEVASSLQVATGATPVQ